MLCRPILFLKKALKLYIQLFFFAKVVVGGSKNSPQKEQIVTALQESCDPVVMVRETHILKLAIWPVLLDVDFTGTKELLYLFLNLRN